MTRLTLRLPDELAERIGKARGLESLNAEIVRRLEASFEDGSMTVASAVEVPTPPARPSELSQVEAERERVVAKPSEFGTGRVNTSRPPGPARGLCIHHRPLTAFCKECPA